MASARASRARKGAERMSSAQASWRRWASAEARRCSAACLCAAVVAGMVVREGRLSETGGVAREVGVVDALVDDEEGGVSGEADSGDGGGSVADECSDGGDDMLEAVVAGESGGSREVVSARFWRNVERKAGRNVSFGVRESRASLPPSLPPSGPPERNHSLFPTTPSSAQAHRTAHTSRPLQPRYQPPNPFQPGPKLKTPTSHDRLRVGKRPALPLPVPAPLSVREIRLLCTVRVVVVGGVAQGADAAQRLYGGRRGGGGGGAVVVVVLVERRVSTHSSRGVVWERESALRAGWEGVWVDSSWRGKGRAHVLKGLDGGMGLARSR